MDKRTILVTGIGGNVGQGILRNCQSSRFSLHLVGTNVTPFSAGNHLCDQFYEVPYADDKDYIKIINELVIKEQVSLILPSTDLEAYYLAKHRENIDCPIVVSNATTTAIYIDKYLTHQHLRDNNIPFAHSFLPSQYNGKFENIILKPRKGRGSRGLFINPKNISKFDDSEYLVQELIKGVEITTAFYVTKMNELNGFITFERFLENGTTTHCKVVTDYDNALKSILEKLLAVSKFQGSINLQSIVTNDGSIIPFEINCRISGTNSIRSNFGFKDVEYTLEEHLYYLQPSKPSIRKGVATRVLMDVIYKEAKDFKDTKTNSSPYFIY